MAVSGCSSGWMSCPVQRGTRPWSSSPGRRRSAVRHMSVRACSASWLPCWPPTRRCRQRRRCQATRCGWASGRGAGVRQQGAGGHQAEAQVSGNKVRVGIRQTFMVPCVPRSGQGSSRVGMHRSGQGSSTVSMRRSKQWQDQRASCLSTLLLKCLRMTKTLCFTSLPGSPTP